MPALFIAGDVEHDLVELCLIAAGSLQLVRFFFGRDETARRRDLRYALFLDTM